MKLASHRGISGEAQRPMALVLAMVILAGLLAAAFYYYTTLEPTAPPSETGLPDIIIPGLSKNVMECGAQAPIDPEPLTGVVRTYVESNPDYFYVVKLAAVEPYLKNDCQFVKITAETESKRHVTIYLPENMPAPNNPLVVLPAGLLGYVGKVVELRVQYEASGDMLTGVLAWQLQRVYSNSF